MWSFINTKLWKIPTEQRNSLEENVVMSEHKQRKYKSINKSSTTQFTLKSSQGPVWKYKACICFNL